MAPSSPSPNIFPELSRTFKARDYYPTDDAARRKRKRKRGGSLSSLEVRKSQVGAGIGVFATRPIPCGDLIIAHEDPIVSSWAASPHFCQLCAAPIGSLLHDHADLRKDASSSVMATEEDDVVFTTNHRSCPQCQKVSWCSRSCWEMGESSHSFLCDNKDSKLHRFIQQQENPLIFQLATQAMLIALCQVQKVPQPQQEPIQRFFWWNDYGSHPQWSTLGSCVKAKEQRANLTTQFWSVIREAVWKQKECINQLQLDQICTVQNIGSILGMLQSNVMEFEYPSPLQQYTQHYMESGMDDVVDETDLPSAVVGSGLYPLLTLANHDCHPNASIHFLQESNRGSLMATRDISENEEICITYVPNGGWGSGDGPRFFRHFVPTRTWKWLNSNNNNNSSGDEEDEPNESGYGDDADDDNSYLEEGGEAAEGDEEESACDDDSGANDEEGSDQRERAKALMEYGFTCQCKRCLEEKGSK